MKFKSYLLNEANIVNIEYDDIYPSIVGSLRKYFIKNNTNYNVKQWINTQLKKWIINNINEDVFDVFDLNKIDNNTKKYYIKKYPWVQKALDKGEKLLYVNSFFIISLIEEYYHKNINQENFYIDHFNDFLNSIPEDEKLDRVSVPQMFKQYKEWNDELKKQKVTAKEDGVKIIYDFKDGFKFVKVFGESSLKREGECMGHCVGGYYNKVKNGLTKIYSLRDKKNESHVTIEYNIKNNSIIQIKGKQNDVVVEKYRPYVIEFINKYFKDLKKADDIENIGMIYINNKLMTVEEFGNLDRIIVNGSLNLNMVDTFVKKLPNYLEVKGDFRLRSQRAKIDNVPDTIKTTGDLLIEGLQIKKIPNNLVAGQDLYMTVSSINDISGIFNIKVGKNLRFDEFPPTKPIDEIKVNKILQNANIAGKISPTKFQIMYDKMKGKK